MNPDGTDERSLTNLLGFLGHPSVSPDGQLIAYHHDGDLYVMRSDGSNPTPLTQTQPSETYPRWSPDGEHLVFVSDVTGYRHLYLMRRDGSEVVPLTSGLQTNTAPAWSPDGTHLVFMSTGDRHPTDGPFHIHTMRVDGTDRVDRTPGLDDTGSPAWSPDGQTIALLARVEGIGGIHLLDLASGDLSLVSAEPNSGIMGWSPDGQQLVYSQPTLDGRHDLFRINQDGSGLVRLTQTAAREDEVTWAP